MGRYILRFFVRDGDAYKQSDPRLFYSLNAEEL